MVGYCRLPAYALLLEKFYLKHRAGCIKPGGEPGRAAADNYYIVLVCQYFFTCLSLLVFCVPINLGIDLFYCRLGLKRELAVRRRFLNDF